MRDVIFSNIYGSSCLFTIGRQFPSRCFHREICKICQSIKYNKLLIRPNCILVILACCVKCSFCPGKDLPKDKRRTPHGYISSITAIQIPNNLIILDLNWRNSSLATEQTYNMGYTSRPAIEKKEIVGHRSMSCWV